MDGAYAFGTYDYQKEVFNGAPWTGYGSYLDTLPASTNLGYRYLRAYSSPVPPLHYSWLSFDGVIVAR